jgi:hypothetical protein
MSGRTDAKNSLSVRVIISYPVDKAHGLYSAARVRETPMPPEPKRTINAKEAVSDIRSGLSADELMQKYRLSAKGLDALVGKLLGAGLLHENESYRRPDDGARVVHVAWKCPACGAAQTREYAECPQCGVIVAKFQNRRSENEGVESQSEIAPPLSAPSPFDPPPGGGTAQQSDERLFSTEASVRADVRSTAVQGFADDQEDHANGIDEEEENTVPEPQTLDRSGWIMLLVGPVAALICFVFFWFRWILETFKTLVHEMGHAIFGWLFGYPSFPAFDVIWGGGVTIHTERSTLLRIIIYIGFAGLFWVYRKNRGTLIFLSILVLIYSVCAFTSIHSVLILFMGHGTELVIAGLFIYRSLSGRAIIHVVERPLYAIIGFFIVFADIGMAYKLLTSFTYRQDYLGAKGGDLDMDFIVIARDYLHSDMSSVVMVFFACCLACLLISFLAFRYMEYLHSAAASLLAREPK